MEFFDGHSLRALAFFPDEIEELLGPIDINDKDSVNRIQKEAPDIRQKAKPVSFLKQYGGMAGKIQKVLKCSAPRAQEISDSYDTLYKESLQFNARNNDFARAHGYVECAFGLRLHTPRISARESGVRSTEERSSNNAVTQSWGMLMNRATNEFDQRVEDAGYTADIKIMVNIHDSVYMLIKEDPAIIQWANENLIECMEWQEHPAIQSDIKMKANLEIGRAWNQQIELSNGASIEEIKGVMESLDD